MCRYSQRQSLRGHVQLLHAREAGSAVRARWLSCSCRCFTRNIMPKTSSAHCGSALAHHPASSGLRGRRASASMIGSSHHPRGTGAITPSRKQPRGHSGANCPRPSLQGGEAAPPSSSGTQVHVSRESHQTCPRPTVMYALRVHRAGGPRVVRCYPLALSQQWGPCSFT